MSFQNYEPYRQTLLTADQLRRLNELNPAIPVRDTILDWLCIFSGWALAALNPSIPTVLLAIPLVGIGYFGLMTIAHDGLHRRLFKSTFMNDLWNDALILAPIGAITRLNRHNHMIHHRETSTESDPDRYKYVHTGRESTFSYVLCLTAMAFVVKSVTNVFFAKNNRMLSSEDQRNKYEPRDIVLLIGWQLALIAGLSSFIAWWAYPVLWLLPVYCFAFAADMNRVFAEHSMILTDDAEADRQMRLVTFSSNFIEKKFCAPHNMNFHAAHHLWPSIPYYHLPRANMLLRESTRGNDAFIWRRSYFKYFFDYWKLQIRKGKSMKVESPKEPAGARK